MITFSELGLTWIDGLIIATIGIAVFILTYFIYPPLIKILKKKGWVGYDIHKTARPETAESGGIGLTIGLLIGIIIMGLIYQPLFREMLVFVITIVIAAIVGLIDDNIQLSSIKKIILMVITGGPLFILNWFGFITVASPSLPLIGQLRLTIIYPLVIPIIIAIMTNTVNMLEGYNGEGSGTSSIAVIFIIICAMIAGSAQGLIFGIPVLAAILAFFMFNKYPAKVFPGDIGTLVIGAAVGLLGIFGSLEVVMALAMLTHIFNSFYVLASVKGFKESHEIKIKDIWVDKKDLIHASSEKNAPLTLPRLILARGPLTEPDLVKNFLALTVISGIFAVISEIVRQWTLENGYHNAGFTIVAFILCLLGYLYVGWKYKRVFGISIIMMLLCLIGLLLFYIIDQFIVTNPLNWLYSFALAGGTLLIWYIITIRYFWQTIDKIQ